MPATPTPPKPPAPSRAFGWGAPWSAGWAAVVLGVGLLLAYANSFSVPFLFDDEDSIVRNPSIRGLASAFFPPTDSGSTVAGRPLLNFSFAINHALGGTGLFGYHFGNLLIHFAAALSLFGVVRRTLRSPRLAPRWGGPAHGMAFAVAALWALHPLQTESVTYLVQRAESLVGLCYLFTFYAFIRSTERSSRGWTVVAVATCFLGMAAKEVMATAPVMLFLYDRVFLTGSWAESWRRRGRLHLGFASSWAVLAGLVFASGGRGATVGFGVVTWHEYALTQAGGILTYLCRAVLPVNLVFDYGAIVEKRAWLILAGLLTVALLLGLALVLLRRRPSAGFVVAWFLVVLAPTSSVVPVVSQTLAEHRMYLPLAAPVVGFVLALWRVAPARGWLVVAPVCVALGVATFARNGDYGSALSIWSDTVRKVPDNVRALNNLGIAYRDAGRADDALRCFREAVDIVPTYATAAANLGATLMKTAPAGGEARARVVQEALAWLEKSVVLDPENALAQSAHGIGLMEAGRTAAALGPLAKAVELAPREWVHRFNHANALAALDRNDEAAAQYAAALELGGDDVDVRINHGALLRRMQRLDEALVHLRAAVESSPDSARAHSQLGVALLTAGRTEEGVGALAAALRLAPELPQARYHLGMELAKLGRPEEAIEHFERLIRIAPPTAEVLTNLGVLYARVGRMEEAVARTRRALEVDPQHAAARENLEKLVGR